MPEKARDANTDVPRLAIACQGGGAHTAFTAGVLAYLFLSFEHFRTIGEEGRWFVHGNTVKVAECYRRMVHAR